MVAAATRRWVLQSGEGKTPRQMTKTFVQLSRAGSPVQMTIERLNRKHCRYIAVADPRRGAGAQPDLFGFDVLAIPQEGGVLAIHLVRDVNKYLKTIRRTRLEVSRKWLMAYGNRLEIWDWGQTTECGDKTKELEPIIRPIELFDLIDISIE